MERIIISLIICLLGTADIMFIISDFKSKHYFTGGMWVMSLCYKLVLLLKANLVGC